MKWQDIGSDVNWTDYGGLWAARNHSSRWFVIRFDNMHEATGEESGDRYHATLYEVDLDSDQLPQALECCGMEYSEDMTDLSDLAKVNALTSYMGGSPLWQDGGNNAWKLVRAAKSEASQLHRSDDAYEAAMEKPVNKIGSTAREYGSGDLNSAILRGLMNGNKDAEILAKMGCLRA